MKINNGIIVPPFPDDHENYYDYRGAYDAIQNGEAKAPDAPGGHWSSQFKSPDHPRAYLTDPTTGRYFDTQSGAYTGGDKEAVPYPTMDRLNAMDIPDLPHSQWDDARFQARGGDTIPSTLSKYEAERATEQSPLDALRGAALKTR